MDNKGYDPQRELRLRNIPKKTIEEVKNVASHIGMTGSEFIKSKVLDFILQYPEHYRKPMNKD